MITPSRSTIPLLTALLLILCSCAGSLGKLEPTDRLAQANAQARSGGFSHVFWPSKPHPLWSYTRLKGKGSDPVYVYIEGDGVLQIKKYGQTFLTDDPSPSPQLPLMLASWHANVEPEDNIVYMARPCQFTVTTGLDRCQKMDWLKGRYSPKSLESFNSALDALRLRLPPHATFHLIGYSGGGTLAMMLANERTDIARVTTLAANLDHEAFFKIHEETYPPPPFSVISHPEKISMIPQLHIIGTQDQIVPESITQAYLSKLKAYASNAPVHLKRIDGLDHHNVERWQKVWQELLSQVKKGV